MSREAMKLALEALEFIPESGSMLGAQAETKRLQGITALREALADHSERPLDMVAAQHKPYRPLQDNGSKYFGAWDKAEQALNRMAENARELGLDYEPDGMHHNKPQKRPQNCGTGYCSCIECVMEPAQQEPVAYLCENAVGHKYFRWKKPSSTYKPIALYTSPPAQRTWVGLTKADWKHLYDEFAMGQELDEFAEDIEAKLKEKNT